MISIRATRTYVLREKERARQKHPTEWLVIRTAASSGVFMLIYYVRREGMRQSGQSVRLQSVLMFYFLFFIAVYDGEYHTPLWRFSKLDCSTTKRGCQYRTMRLRKALGETFFNVDVFGTATIPTVEISSMENRPRGCDLHRRTRYTLKYREGMRQRGQRLGLQAVKMYSEYSFRLKIRAEKRERKRRED